MLNSSGVAQDRCSAPGTGAPPEPPEPHVSIERLAVARSGRRLVEDLNWPIRRGTFAALVGPSGTGKTSLLLCLAGLLRSEAGQVQYTCSGGCRHSPQSFQRRIGFIYQDLRLVRNSDLLTNVLCGRLGAYPWWRTLWGFPQQDRTEAFALLEQLGVGAYARRSAREVSGGEVQRAAVARALLQNPELILADEPVSQLDARNAENVLSLIKHHTRTRQMTVLCALHNPDLVRRYADCTLYLDPSAPSQWRVENCA